VGGECNISLSMAVPVEEAVAALATFSLEVSVGFISLFCHSRHRCVRRFHSGFLFWVWEFSGSFDSCFLYIGLCVYLTQNVVPSIDF
jgi:hypothetical protein